MLLIYEEKEKMQIINFDNIINICAEKIDEGDLEYSKHDGKKGMLVIHQADNRTTTLKYANYETVEQIANNIISANIDDDDVYYFPED